MRDDDSLDCSLVEPYALDSEGELYAETQDRELLAALLPEVPAPGAAESAARAEDWIVVRTPDPYTELTFGVARPIRESLQGIRRTAARNFGYGLAMILAALMGVFLISSGMTQRLETLTDATEKLAAGDLETRVPVTSNGLPNSRTNRARM